MPAARALDRPFSRSLREALESVACDAVVPQLVARALASAGRGVVPEDAGPFAAFVEGPLRTVIVETLGQPSYDAVAERLSHVLAMATSQVRARERGDEHDARPLGPPRTEDTVRPPRHAPVRVLIATLDPLLIAETEARLAGRSAVFTVRTTVELSAQIAIAGGRVTVVVDTALPSIDVASLAALAPTFPAGTPVVLWGMSERQKERLVAMFPVAAGWAASGAAHSPADLLAG